MPITPIINSLETERLILREITPEIYRLAFTTWNDHDIISFFSLGSNDELLKEKIKFQDGLTTFNKSFLYFQLIEKSTNGIIGWCGFHTWYLPHQRAELGYEINADHHKGKGYMKEAIRPIIRYGFERMQLNRIEAFVGPDNQVSLALIKNLGFTEEGSLRKHYYKNNRYEDSIVFSLLKSEFKGTW